MDAQAVVVCSAEVFGKVGGDVVFAQFADFALQGAEEVVRGDGVGVELFGVVVFVEEAGEVALFFALAGDEGVAVVVVFGAGVAGAAAFEFA